MTYYARKLVKRSSSSFHWNQFWDDGDQRAQWLQASWHLFVHSFLLRSTYSFAKRIIDIILIWFKHGYKGIMYTKWENWLWPILYVCFGSLLCALIFLSVFSKLACAWILSTSTSNLLYKDIIRFSMLFI